MSRNGSGTYTLPAGNPVVTGTTISSTWANSTLTNIASALTDSLAADGQTTATGNLKMGNNRVTGMADGIASTDAASVAQVAASVAGLGTMSTQNANAVAITGGAINGTTVGATTASTGAFTNFTASGTASFTSTGAVKVPVGTTGQQPSPVTGMIRFNSTTSLYEGYGTSAWGALGGGATGGGSDQIFNLNGQTVTTSYSIPNGKNASSAGPITIDTAATVTIPTGSVWVIV
jgi:cobalamin biosynthesis Mg chelatase CobN